ncbi:MAG: LysR substrate-binding domain-containing protein [Trebonia sp.]
MAADHPLASRDSPRLEDLADTPVIRPDLPPMSCPDMRAEVAPTQEERYHSPNPELVRCLVGRGLGYAIVVQHPPGELTYDGRRVTSVPIAGDVQEVSVVLAYPRGVDLTRRADALAEFCTTVAR